MSGGLTFGAAKPILASVVENGVCSDDPRVILRTNEATAAILDEIIPVGGMITADITADGDELFLPKEFENAIEVEVVGASVNGQTDIVQGWYVVNQFAYVDPSAAHDNPLVDLYLQPDPFNSTVLRRKYRYPGLTPNAVVRVTGAKRYVPIIQDSDFLIVQNILAVKDMIQSIERKENNDIQGSELYHKASIDRLMAEVKKHQLDPLNSLKRKANYDADMVNYAQGTFGWTRARLAFELPNGLMMGKSELTRIIEQAEMALIDAGQWVGTLQEYTASIDSETILAPKEVEAIVAIDLCGHPLNIQSLHHRYVERGHRWWGSCVCCPELRDEGENFNKTTGVRRRQYRLIGARLSETTETFRTIRFIGALRWVKKVPSDPLVIKNFEAMRLMCMSILDQKTEKWKEATANKQGALQEVDKELARYLAGQIITAPVNMGTGFRRHGLL